MPTRKFPRAKPHKLSPVEVKAVVRHRDCYRCQGCGITAREHVRRHGRTLDVHRIVPGSRYTVKGCVTLCKKCHDPQPKSAKRRAGEFTVTRLGEEAMRQIEELRKHFASIDPFGRVPSISRIIQFAVAKFHQSMSHRKQSYAVEAPTAQRSTKSANP